MLQAAAGAKGGDASAKDNLKTLLSEAYQVIDKAVSSQVYRAIDGRIYRPLLSIHAFAPFSSGWEGDPQGQHRCQEEVHDRARREGCHGLSLIGLVLYITGNGNTGSAYCFTLLSAGGGALRRCFSLRALSGWQVGYIATTVSRINDTIAWKCSCARPAARQLAAGAAFRLHAVAPPPARCRGGRGRAGVERKVFLLANGDEQSAQT